MKRAELAADEQMAILADRYSQRAEAYDGLWSPIIRPVGERLIARLPLSARTSHVIDIGTGAGAGGSKRRNRRHRSVRGHAPPGKREACWTTGTHGCA